LLKSSVFFKDPIFSMIDNIASDLPFVMSDTVAVGAMPDRVLYGNTPEFRAP
jgi:hypothetical protein